MFFNCGVGKDLKVPWIARRSNQSILKEISPEYSLEGLCWSWSSNTLATWCKELTHLKDLEVGKDWRREEKGMTEDEMVGWHHHLNGHEFEQAPGAGYGWGRLVCCSPWGRKQLDMTEWLNWSDYSFKKNTALFIWLCRAVVVAWGVFCCRAQASL